MDFWEKKLRREAAQLSSLSYFKPDFYSLASPHPIWTMAGTNPNEVEKAVIQARMLSGRYRCEKLRRHWFHNTAGFCELSPCFDNGEVGSIEHMLLHCSALSSSRSGVLHLWNRTLQEKPELQQLFHRYSVMEPDKLVQFLLDPSTLSEVILTSQSQGPDVLKFTFYLTRTMCYTLHKAKMKLLGLY